MELSGRRAIITGANRGLGLEIARAFVAAGASVLLTARDESLLHDAAEGLRAAAALGVAPEDVVFLDDTPECVEGARTVGMHAIQVDPADRQPAFGQARGLLGIQA